MEDLWFKLLFMLVGGIALVCSIVFGYDCLYVFIPLAIACGIYFWYTSRDYEGKRNLGNAIYTTIGIAVALFILTFVGSCIGGCTKGGGDTTQQRIEMGVPLY